MNPGTSGLARGLAVLQALAGAEAASAAGSASCASPS